MPETNQEERGSVVYRVNILTNNKFYIGSTCDIYRRLRDHFNGKSGCNKHLTNCVRLYGLDNVEVLLLHQYLTREEAYILEQKYLDQYFNDPLNLNFSWQAKGFNNEVNKNPIHERSTPEELIEVLDLSCITKKDIKRRYNLELDPDKMTTRQLIEYKRDNRSFKYAIKEPSGNIVYVREWGLEEYCRNNNIKPSRLFIKGYVNNYFMTKDLTKEGIKKLEAAVYKINKGNTKKYKVYFEGEYLETIENLNSYAKEKNLNINSCRFLAAGKTKKPHKGYTFKIDNEQNPRRIFK